MKIVIAGCGIGGLAAALGLSRSKHEVILVEKADQLEPIGAGISLQPNAMQALHCLGVDQQVAEAGHPSKIGRLMIADGKTLKQFDFSISYAQRYGWLPITIHRAELIRLMAESLDPTLVQVILGDAVETYSEQATRVVVRLQSGQQLEGDALIGADGIHSNVRKQLWATGTPQYSGYTCWRGIIGDPAIVSACNEMVECWGKGARFGFMRCSETQVYWFATENRSTPSENSNDSSAWIKTFQNWPLPIPEILQLTPNEDIVHNDIWDRDPIFPWGRGHVTLLGDAAHAMTPNFGQGGAQALEDAVILAKSVQRHDAIETAFRKYESFRHPRTSQLVIRSRKFGNIAQGGNRWRRFVRNHLLSRIPDRFVDKMLADQFDFQSQLEQFATQCESEIRTV